MSPAVPETVVLPRASVTGTGVFAFAHFPSPEAVETKMLFGGKFVEAHVDILYEHTGSDVVARFRIPAEHPLHPGCYELHWKSGGGRSGAVAFIVPDSVFNLHRQVTREFGNINFGWTYIQEMQIPAGADSARFDLPFVPTLAQAVTFSLRKDHLPDAASFSVSRDGDAVFSLHTSAVSYARSVTCVII